MLWAELEVIELESVVAPLTPALLGPGLDPDRIFPQSQADDNAMSEVVAAVLSLLRCLASGRAGRP